MQDRVVIFDSRVWFRRWPI